MTDARQGSTLGQRIIAAARMAAMEHLAQLHREESHTTRRQASGGAGNAHSTDGVLFAETLASNFSAGTHGRAPVESAEGGRP